MYIDNLYIAISNDNDNIIFTDKLKVIDSGIHLDIEQLSENYPFIFKISPFEINIHYGILVIFILYSDKYNKFDAIIYQIKNDKLRKISNVIDLNFEYKIMDLKYINDFSLLNTTQYVIPNSIVSKINTIKRFYKLLVDDKNNAKIISDTFLRIMNGKKFNYYITGDKKSDQEFLLNLNYDKILELILSNDNIKDIVLDSEFMTKYFDKFRIDLLQQITYLTHVDN